MTTPGAGIGLGCTSCGVERVLTAQDEAEVREGLATFFAAHEGCAVHVDVSRAQVPLPR